MAHLFPFSLPCSWPLRAGLSWQGPSSRAAQLLLLTGPLQGNGMLLFSATAGFPGPCLASPHLCSLCLLFARPLSRGFYCWAPLNPVGMGCSVAVEQGAAVLSFGSRRLQNHLLGCQASVVGPRAASPVPLPALVERGAAKMCFAAQDWLRISTGLSCFVKLRRNNPSCHGFLCQGLGEAGWGWKWE